MTVLGVCVLLLSLGICMGQTAPVPSPGPIADVHLTLGASPSAITVTWQSNQVVDNAMVTAWPARLGQTPPANEKDLIVSKPQQHTYKNGAFTVNVSDAVS